MSVWFLIAILQLFLYTPAGQSAPHRLEKSAVEGDPNTDKDEQGSKRVRRGRWRKISSTTTPLHQRHWESHLIRFKRPQQQMDRSAGKVIVSRT